MQRFCLCIWNADKPWDKRLEDIGAVFPDILVYWGSRPSDSIIEEAGIIYHHDFFLTNARHNRANFSHLYRISSTLFKYFRWLKNQETITMPCSIIVLFFKLGLVTICLTTSCFIVWSIEASVYRSSFQLIWKLSWYELMTGEILSFQS